MTYPSIVVGTDTAIGRVRTVGLAGASVIDLLAIALSRREDDVEKTLEAARKLVADRGVAGIWDLAPETLLEAGGLDRFEALRWQALIELGKKAKIAGRGTRGQVDHADAVYELLNQRLRGEKREHFYAVLLDAQNRILHEALIHVGTLTMSLVGPREVFREAVREGASSVIVAHNHPSGDPTPSPEDIAITKELVKVGNILDIPVLDHIVIGYDNFVSLKAKGLM